MPVREHVHIISAGENIHTGYPAAFRILPDITRTIVFADSAIYEISPNQETEKSRRAVRDAVNTVKEIALSLAIPFSRELIFPPTYPSVRDTLAKIHREFPGTRFTFDISAGSKSLCVALLAMAFWLDAEVYSTFDEREMRKAPLPDRSVRSLLENPNYQTILAVLLRNGKNEGKTVIPAWVSRQYIFKQLGAVYIPIRTKRKKPDTAPVQPVTSKRSRKPAAGTDPRDILGFHAITSGEWTCR